MTLHAAKGLEFPVVFITGLEEGLFPLGSAAEEPRSLKKSARLMYVGITRAKEKLYLSYALTRYRYGESSFATRSRFLDEIDEASARNAPPHPRAHGIARQAPRRAGRRCRVLPASRRPAALPSKTPPRPDAGLRERVAGGRSSPGRGAAYSTSRSAGAASSPSTGEATTPGPLWILKRWAARTSC